MTTIFKPMGMSNGGQTQQPKLVASRYVPLAKAIEPKNPALLRQRPTSTVEPKHTLLRFVNITNPDQCKSNPNRKLVRSIASKSSGRPLDAHKAKKAARPRAQKPRPSGSLAGTYSSDGADLPFVKVKQKASAEKCLPTMSSDKKEPEKCLPVMSLEKFEAASCDPFKVYPSDYTSLGVNLVGSYLRLLADPSSIYFNAFQSQITDQMLVPIALSAPVLYHAMVYTASTHFFGMELKFPLEHRIQAIRLVRESIHEPSAFPDETAFAIAMVGITEFLHGDALQALVHFQGLVQIIRTRGGIRKFRNPLLRNLLEWLHGIGTSSLRSCQEYISHDYATINSAQIMLTLVEFAPLTKQIINQLDSLEFDRPLGPEIAHAVQKLSCRQTREDEVLELEDGDDPGWIEYPTVWKGSRNALRPCNLARELI